MVEISLYSTNQITFNWNQINFGIFRHQSNVWSNHLLFVHFIYVICCVLSDNHNKNDFRLRTKLSTIHKTPIIRQTYPCSPKKEERAHFFLWYWSLASTANKKGDKMKFYVMKSDSNNNTGNVLRWTYK